MILRKIALSLVGGAFVVISTLSSLTAQADPASISTAPVVFIAPPDFPPVAGASSKIVRNDNGVTVSVKTTVDPGTYTMWMVLWNEGGPDGPPDCVLFTAGHVVGNNGTLNYSGHRRVYDSSGSIVEEGVPGPPCASGLTNPQGAEVHLVIRSHGPKLPGLVKQQIGSLLGGCDINDCVDVQAAIHPLKP